MAVSKTTRFERTFHTQNSEATCRALGPHSVHIIRKYSPKHEFQDVDTFGPYWTLTLGDLPPGAVKMRTAVGHEALAGKTALFIPPYSVVEWNVAKIDFEFEAIVSREPLTGIFPKTAVTFTSKTMALPLNPEGVLELVRSAADLKEVGLEQGQPALALRTKAAIDRQYQEDVPIAEIARQLKSSHPRMTMGFSNAFGLSPVQYRNRLRIAQSWLKLVLSNASISEIGQEVGFRDLSRFNKQFLRQQSTRPSSYRR